MVVAIVILSQINIRKELKLLATVSQDQSLYLNPALLWLYHLAHKTVSEEQRQRLERREENRTIFWLWLFLLLQKENNQNLIWPKCQNRPS